MYKGDGGKEDCGNYRGIALLSIVGKLFARILNGRLVPFLEEHELVEEQGGFRRGRGCVDVLYTYSEVVRGRKMEGKSTYCAFIDVRKHMIEFGEMVYGKDCGTQECRERCGE